MVCGRKSWFWKRRPYEKVPLIRDENSVGSASDPARLKEWAWLSGSVAYCQRLELFPSVATSGFATFTPLSSSLS
jgi:hypothetical protein